jgi:hypothetical protein
MQQSSTNIVNGIFHDNKTFSNIIQVLNNLLCFIEKLFPKFFD